MSRVETYFRQTAGGMTREFMLATKDLFYRFVSRTDHYIFTRSLQIEDESATNSYVYDIYNEYLGPDRGNRWTFNPQMTTEKQAIRIATTSEKNRNFKTRLKRK